MWAPSQTSGAVFSPFFQHVRGYLMFYKEPGYKICFRLETWSCNQSFTSPCSGIEGAGSQLLQAKLILPFGPLSPCQAPATCKGATPQSWRGDKQVEAVRSYKRNIAEVQAAKIKLQRLMFDPCSCLLELEPSPPLGDSTLCSIPHPRKAVGVQSSLGWKLKYFTPEKENSPLVLLFFYFPQLFLLLVPPFSPHHLPPWQFHHPFQPEQTSALRADSSSEEHEAAQRENCG